MDPFLIKSYVGFSYLSAIIGIQILGYNQSSMVTEACRGHCPALNVFTESTECDID
ncbi:hypothetical protein CCACVL1_08836 [Corchorus capsularis]|uniref:Uncharacterized protein n=1 Tax=Corchorus capsularis TaxID=210143 RepID=A0A1R3IYL8_COCAP|nr:hypothetical protein CCACVL1_08836 [Corchorus capsularis]